MADDDLIIDAERAFVDELVVLCKRHGFVIDACGCCDSPWIVPIKDASLSSIPSFKDLTGSDEPPDDPVAEFRMTPP
jgi:hypothetical protein